MKIKKRSGDKEHCLRLLPCLRRRPSHPHQDEQLVNYLVHPFWKMLEQFIWYAVGTRSSSGTGVFNLGSLGSGGGSRPGFRNFMQGIGRPASDAFLSSERIQSAITWIVVINQLH
ncbi:TPA: hypothetical protein ACH3X3_005331 [Trebouxia sp. C0006]